MSSKSNYYKKFYIYITKVKICELKLPSARNGRLSVIDTGKLCASSYFVI